MGELNPPTAADYAANQAEHARDDTKALAKRVRLLEAQVKVLMGIASHALHVARGYENVDYNWPKGEE